MGEYARALAACDLEAVAIAWLAGHADVTAALGGQGRVGSTNEPPYPRLNVYQGPSGVEGTMRRVLSPTLTIEALGDPNGVPGKAALRRLLYTALGAMVELPDAPVTDPTLPVITHIESSAGGGWAPMPVGVGTAQGRYLASVRVWGHPPLTVP